MLRMFVLIFVEMVKGTAQVPLSATMEIRFPGMAVVTAE